MISGPLPEEQNLHNYKLIKHQMQLPLKIHLYFTFLEAALENDEPTKNYNSSETFSPLFYSVFCQLSSSEKAHYLHSNISYLKKQYDKFETETSSTLNPFNNGSNISASGQISETLFGLTYWGKLKISVNFENKQAKLETKNRNFCIDLRLYLIRKSKKYKNTLVLEAISDIVTSGDRKLSLFFKETIFDKIYQELLNCILAYRNQELFKIALESSETNQSSSEISYIGNKSKSLNFLSSKNVNEFLNFKDFVLKKILKADFTFENLFTDHSCKIEFDRNRNRKNNIYKMEACFEMPVSSLKKNFLEKYKSQSFKHIIQCQSLEKFSQKFSAVYQKLLFKISERFQEMEQIIIEEINDKDILCENEELIFQKGVTNIKMNSFIEFLMIKVKGLGTSNRSKLIVVAAFNEMANDETHDSNRIVDIQQNQQIIVMFLLEFYEMVNRKEVEIGEIQKMLKELRSFDGFSGLKENESVETNDFVTVQGNFAYGDHNELVLNADDFDTAEDNEDERIMKGKEVQQQNFKKGTLSLDSKTLPNFENPLASIKEPEIKIFKSNSYLAHCYQLFPQPETSQDKKVSQKHFLFDEWYRKSKGGLTCKDNTAINEQNKIANQLLSSLGKRILDNKGLFNMSLPVNIFKPESHLESVAKNLSFTPIVLEKACEMSPVERIKQCALYSLFMTISSISVSKPFNPILGETLQKWINGCPVYLEQISHHPPIVAYYMLGRGYKVYGSIGPKTTFGFNSLIGYSDEPNFIEFDDGTIIEVSFGKMVISGIILGERSFNFEDQMFIIDSKNRLFCSIKLGKEKGSFFSMSSEHDDCVNGKIVRVTESFIKEFYSLSKAMYPKNEDEEEEISKMQGIWNGKIFFDEKEYADFNTANGCEISDEEFILPSDSSYRQDIEYLRKGCLGTSQNEKEKLEEIQRRDHRLRKNFQTHSETKLNFE